MIALTRQSIEKHYLFGCAMMLVRLLVPFILIAFIFMSFFRKWLIASKCIWNRYTQIVQFSYANTNE